MRLLQEALGCRVLKMMLARIILAMISILAISTGSSISEEKAIASAVDYILSCHNEDGGFGSDPESKSDIKDTSLAVIALASAGRNPSNLSVNGSDPGKFLLDRQDELFNMSNVEAQVGRYVVALNSVGIDPRDARGKNYPQILKGFIHPGGAIGADNYIWDDAWVIMALAACNESQSGEVKSALDHLMGQQMANGGWSWNGGPKDDDVDTTGIILCALMSGGVNASSDAVSRGLDYLSSEQNDDGGFSSLGSNAASDGWAIMALNAAGQEPKAWKVGSADPVQNLISLQQADGSIWWKGNSKGISFEWTANMIIALAGGEVPPAINGRCILVP